ncbi:tetratricopeptide repeat protein [Reichenbachiella agarivorans]|uniref:Tetratricopeptide repeat protein n=1 Tax=Reichenbachiella agarivorans TaxID=2979464 RepID=A0ABY6CU91_9BACT|nr:tetratricopeptide repeat protein [Reichenbachiella agarivorans]UXP34053.1 tetratricopeptide repeat protein [Reichenbachiella agarivorans]
MIASAAQMNHDPDSMISLLQHCIQLSAKNQYISGLANSHFHLGELYYNVSDRINSMKHLQEAQVFFEDLDDQSHLMLLHKMKGNIYGAMIDPTTAMEEYKIALAIAEKLSSNDQALKIKNNIGIIYQEQGHYQEAERYFRESLSMEPSLSTQIAVLGNIGLTKQKQNNFDSALYYYEEALLLAQQSQDSVSMYAIVDYLTSLYWKESMPEKALIYCLDLVDYHRNTQNEWALIHAYNMLGLIYHELRDYQRSESYYEMSLVLAHKYQSKNEAFILANMAFNEAAAGKYEEAYNHLFTHLSVKDTLFSLEKSRQLEEALAQYESEKKEKEIAVLQAEQKLHEANLEKQQLIRNTALGGSVLLLISSVLLISIYAQKLKTNKILAEKNEEINQRNIKTLLKENEIANIKASLEGQEKERMRIARELHDGVAGSLAAVKLNLESMLDSNSSPALLKKAISDVNFTYQEVRTLSHNLSPYKVLKAPFVQLVRDYVHEMAESSGIDIRFVASGNLSFHELSDPLKIEIYRILQELVINLIKHSQAQYAEVVLTKNDLDINLIVEDEGIGFDPKRKHKGIGYDNIYHRVEILKGKIQIDSVKGRGTIVNIDLPLPIQNEETLSS